MSIFDRFFPKTEIDDSKYDELANELAIRSDNMTLLQERLAELELSLEDQGWNVLSSTSNKEFSRDGLRTINYMARLYFLKNPLIRRAVLTQTQYVFGQGVNIQAVNPQIDEVVQEFINHSKNKAELTEHQALMVKETELQCFSNHFFVFFINISNGEVRVRTIPCDEIDEIITNPEDAKDVWYYKRMWTSEGVDVSTGQYRQTSQTAYYPDWRYKPTSWPATIGGQPVMKDNPIYHVSVNRLSDMKFGVSEIYSAIDWARAYKEFLENWASIVKAYSRFAWRLTAPKGSGAAGVASLKAKLQSTIGTAGTETKPAPATGSMAIGSPGVGLEPIRTAGAQTSAEDGRYLRLMVSSATGIFEHYLTGDPSTGNLATAKAMELPMLIMFQDRQQLWSSVLGEIIDFVILQAVKAGQLPGHVEVGDYGDEVIIWDNDVDNPDPEQQEQPIDGTVSITFPNILEKDIAARVNAVVSAATLNGQMLAGTLDAKLVTRMLLEALGLDNINDIMDEMFPAGEETGEEPPPDEPPETTVKEAFKKALSKLSEYKL